MNRFFTTFLATIIISPSLFATGLTTNMYCSSLENPSTLLLKLESPDPTDQCDISYEDDCGKTKVNYTLTADLSNPHGPLVGASLDRVTDEFFEKESNGLQISTDDFDIQLAAGFRQSMRSGIKVPVTIESHVVTDGTGLFQLYCELR